MTAALVLFLAGLALVSLATSRRIVGAMDARWMMPTGLVMIVLALGMLAMAASAQPVKPAPAAARKAVTVPDASAVYRRWVEQAVAEEWGIDGSPARLAAQLHQESSWNPRAKSPVGAEGLAQFMPGTTRWIAQAFPRRLGDFDPWNPQQAALAAAVYDAWLAKRNPGANACANWAFALSAYNGGERALWREQALARSAGRNAGVWFGDVANYRSRTEGAWRENRGYVRHILVVLEPAYIDAGWSGEAVCA